MNYFDQFLKNNKIELYSEADNTDKEKDAPDTTKSPPPIDDTPEDEESSPPADSSSSEPKDIHNDVDDFDPHSGGSDLDSQFDDIFNSNSSEDNETQPNDGSGTGDSTDDMSMNDLGDGAGDNTDDDSVYLGDDENDAIEGAAEDEDAVMKVVKERFAQLYNKYDTKRDKIKTTDFNRDIDEKLEPIIDEYNRVIEQLYTYTVDKLGNDSVAVQIKTFTEFKFLLETLDKQIEYILIEDEDEQ